MAERLPGNVTHFVGFAVAAAVQVHCDVWRDRGGRRQLRVGGTGVRDAGIPDHAHKAQRGLASRRDKAPKAIAKHIQLVAYIRRRLKPEPGLGDNIGSPVGMDVDHAECGGWVVDHDR